MKTFKKIALVLWILSASSVATSLPLILILHVLTEIPNYTLNEFFSLQIGFSILFFLSCFSCWVWLEYIKEV